ncbi:MAG: phage terminase large subunit family protein [Desulfobacteraceae bacterium]|nr:phage terminase large subunit family protein [Desulfobacteraceae bacterium]
MYAQKSSAGSTKSDLFDQLCDSLNQRYGTQEAEKPLHEWVLGGPIMLDGKPFSFHRHECLETPYRDIHPYQVEMKAAQVGNTTKAILRVIHACRYRNFRGILYLFPSAVDVADFSRSRLTPLIAENAEILEAGLQDTDSIGLKRLWGTNLYLRGMRSRVGLKSVPADFIAFDELDEAPPNAVDMAMERMAHSEFKEVMMLSNPTLPDYGIDKKFQETDQRYWLLKCPKCGEYTCLEDTFPDCLAEFNDGRIVRLCQSCRDGELEPAVGQWIAKKPGVIDKRGYHYSQLFSQFVDPADILHLFRTTNNLQDFYNLKLGLPYVEASNRLSRQEVLALCENEGISGSDTGPCSMGVDQGKDLHVVIGKHTGGKKGRVIHLGIYRDWEELDGLMNRFRVSRCVVDALPETRKAREFAKRFTRGRVFLNYYSHHQKGSYAWNEREMTVSCNRTESLDASHLDILNANISLPRECGIVAEFASHCNNVAKKLEEDEETGSKRYIYVKLGPDHFRHAFNYEAMARQFGASSLFGDCDLS